MPWPTDRVPVPRGRRTWIDANALEGWLLAYEGETPVFATMIAPGRGSGAGTSTPGGIFSVTGKFVTATLATDDPAYAEVPWVQNYFGAYAIHSTYWHDAFGERRSSGCLNVSPEDGRTLFRFTEPEMPEGWHAVRASPREHATYVFVDTSTRR